MDKAITQYHITSWDHVPRGCEDRYIPSHIKITGPAYAYKPHCALSERNRKLLLDEVYRRGLQLSMFGCGRTYGARLDGGSVS